MLLSAGCDSGVTPPAGSDRPSFSFDGSDARFSEVAARTAPRSVDARFLAVNERVPGFAGVILEAGRPTLLLTDEAAASAAREALFDQLPRRTARWGDFQVRVVEHEWVDLLQWRAKLRGLLTDMDVLALDADEARNRVPLAVVAGFDESRLVSEVARRGVPTEAVVFTISGPAELASDDLTDRVRPTVGGLQLGIVGSGACTLGFNVALGNGPAFLTNSHCTRDWFEATGDTLYQAEWNQATHRVGTEKWDPDPYEATPGDSELLACQTADTLGLSSWSCRWSDAAVFDYESGLDAVKGHIARTVSADRWNGSTTIVGTFRIVDKYTAVTVGDTLHKVGRTTGWTFGNVSQTCVDRYHPLVGGLIMLCQDHMKAGIDGGDSGSPVFLQSTNNEVELAGLAWGEVPSDSILIFSPIQNIEDDFNATFDVTGAPPLSTWIAGPGQVRSSEWCTWQAFTDGGESPFHYAWSGVLSGSGSQNWIGGTVSASGWLSVTVTSDDNQQASASFWVEVSASAPDCAL